VSEQTFSLVDRSRPEVSHGRLVSPYRKLTTLVWAPDAPGLWPLVVFAPGFQVGPAPYEAFLEAWAARGYVVAAPEFPLTDAAVAGANLDESDIDQQPADVRFVTDWMVSVADPLARRIDPAEVAVAGHSDGGETALAAAEAAVPPGEPRFRAVVAMSVQPLGTRPASFGPLLVTQGDADTINPPSYGLAAYRLAEPPKYLLVLRGGGHLPPLEAGSPWLPGLEAVSEAFLAAYVAGSAPPSAIAAAAAGNPLLSLESSPAPG
jgi:dienelactone hydrolase